MEPVFSLNFARNRCSFRSLEWLSNFSRSIRSVLCSSRMKNP